jgi:hypothetical protein
MQSQDEPFHLAGQLSKFQLGNVLQLLAMSQVKGRLELRSQEPASQARIYVAGGMLLEVEMVEADSGKLSSLKALERVLEWQDGHFSFVQGSEPKTASINQPLNNALLSTHQRMDERRNLLAALPQGHEILRIVAEPPQVPMLNAEEWRILALVNGKHSLLRIAEKAADDVAALAILQALMAKGAVEVKSVVADRSWQSILPQVVPASSIQGERPFPSHIRANVLLKAVDGKRTLGDLDHALAMTLKELFENVRYLRDLRWISFSSGDSKRLETFYSEVVA